MSTQTKSIFRRKPICHYHHLPLLEREKLLFLRAKSCSISPIAATLGRDKSTISRELHRSTVNGTYIPVTAQKQYVRRRKACRPHKRFEDKELFASVRKLFLGPHWSPEEIADPLQLEHHKPVLSYVTMYRAMYTGMFEESPLSHGARGAVRHMRRRGKSHHTRQHTERRSSIPISHNISERTAGVTHCSRRGYWECDTVAERREKPAW